MQNLICAGILTGFVLGCIAWARFCARFIPQDDPLTVVKVIRPGAKPWIFYATGGDLINDLQLALYCAEMEASHE